MSDLPSKIISALKTDNIIPDVIPASYSFTPSIVFSVVWPSEGLKIVFGDKVPREKTLDEPELEIQARNVVPDDSAQAETAAAAGEVKYTLVMTDPDAPSREDPKFGQWRHWVLSGVQLPAANAPATENVYASKPKTAETPYYPPAPPPGSGYHRYVFLLFQEPSGGVSIRNEAVERKGDPKSRPKWDALAFAEEYGLKLVGINYFMTQVSK